MSEDQTITCVDCTAKFTWSASEQELYSESGFSAPKQCKLCKEARKNSYFRASLEVARETKKAGKK